MAAKSYLRYKQEKLLGLVASPTAGIICDKPGFLVLAAGLEDVLVWNMRSGTQVSSVPSLRPAAPPAPDGCPFTDRATGRPTRC